MKVVLEDLGVLPAPGAEQAGAIETTMPSMPSPKLIAAVRDPTLAARWPVAVLVSLPAHTISFRGSISYYDVGGVSDPDLSDLRIATQDRAAVVPIIRHQTEHLVCFLSRYSVTRCELGPSGMALSTTTTDLTGVSLVAWCKGAFDLSRALSRCV